MSAIIHNSVDFAALVIFTTLAGVLMQVVFKALLQSPTIQGIRNMTANTLSSGTCSGDSESYVLRIYLGYYSKCAMMQTSSEEVHNAALCGMEDLGNLRPAIEQAVGVSC